MLHKMHNALSNGQVASLYFHLDRGRRFTDGYRYDCWEVGFVVGDHRSLNNRWWKGRTKLYDGKSTGKCGLEALIWAKNAILAFMSRRESDVYQYMVVRHADERRGRVYKRLLREDFVAGVHDEEPVLMKAF